MSSWGWLWKSQCQGLPEMRSGSRGPEFTDLDEVFPDMTNTQLFVLSGSPTAQWALAAGHVDLDWACRVFTPSLYPCRKAISFFRHFPSPLLKNTWTLQRWQTTAMSQCMMRSLILCQTFLRRGLVKNKKKNRSYFPIGFPWGYMVVVPSRKVDIRSLRCLSGCRFITNTGVVIMFFFSRWSWRQDGRLGILWTHGNGIPDSEHLSLGLEYLDSCFSISKQSPGLAIDGGLLTCICNKPDGAFPPIPLSLAIAAVAVRSPLQLPSLGRWSPRTCLFPSSSGPLV